MGCLFMQTPEINVEAGTEWCSEGILLLLVWVQVYVYNISFDIIGFRKRDSDRSYVNYESNGYSVGLCWNFNHDPGFISRVECMRINLNMNFKAPGIYKL